MVRRRMACLQSAEHSRQHYPRPFAALWRIWLFLHEWFLSLAVWPDSQTIIEACCLAWNAPLEKDRRIITLCSYPWIKKSLHRIADMIYYDK